MREEGGWKVEKEVGKSRKRRPTSVIGHTRIREDSRA
jgi:hypothetical protein